jgi:hypothetical protein
MTATPRTHADDYNCCCVPCTMQRNGWETPPHDPRTDPQVGDRLRLDWPDGSVEYAIEAMPDPTDEGRRTGDAVLVGVMMLPNPLRPSGRWCPVSLADYRQAFAAAAVL